jgi:hypothetical protein
MKKIFLFVLVSIFLIQPSFAWTNKSCSILSDEHAIKKMLNYQVKVANKQDFDKFISTYDENYSNSDGMNLETYSEVVKNTWNSYSKIKYGIKVKDISIDNDIAKIEVIETASANLPAPKSYEGELKSLASSVYYLKKSEGKWKVKSEYFLEESTSMLYGDAKDLDIQLTVPKEIEPNTEYTATLEFTPPKETIAIASLSSDGVEYPQKPVKEVFRALPEDNILERLFTSNKDNSDEYIVASIGLTKTAVDDLSIKYSLTGFGYVIKRVNVIRDSENVENK